MSDEFGHRNWFSDDPEWEPQPVPRDFHSEYLSGPFLRCVDCECELLDSEEVYAVIKSVVAGETVFEMALCGACSTSLADSYSDHSKRSFERNIQAWREQSKAAAENADEQPDLGDKQQHTPRLREGSVDSLAHCAGCGRPRGECRRYAIVGAFVGRVLVAAPSSGIKLPLLVCDQCNSHAAENISTQTRDSWDRFVEDHFDGPPGIDLDVPRLDPVLI